MESIGQSIWNRFYADASMTLPSQLIKLDCSPKEGKILMIDDKRH